METLKKPKSFYLLILTGCLGSLFMGYQLGIYNTCQFAISSDYNFNSDEDKQLYEGIISSAISLGAIIGSFYASSLLKNGRRIALIITDCLSIFSSLFVIFPNIILLILSRILSGICVGLNSVAVPIFIKEFSPPEISGTTGSFHSVLISFGVLISFFFGFIIPFNQEFEAKGLSLWKLLFSFPILICSLRIFLFFRYFQSDTPPFLWKAKKESSAKIIMESLYTEEYNKNFVKTLNKSDENVKRYKDLFSPKFEHQMKFGILLSVIQQFSGITAVIFYSNKIFSEDGNEKIAVFFTFLVGILLTITAVISGKFMDIFGRRKAMIYGDFFCVVSLGLLVLLKPTSLAFLNKYVILMFIFCFGVSLGPILWVYLSETLPEKGVSLATLINWITCLLIALIFPKLINSSMQFTGTFMIFFVSSALGFIYIIMNMVETKGKTQIEIKKMCQYESVNLLIYYFYFFL